ncbi:equilibrative nucleoside transporter 1-like [Brienomyrus brachyistius]|uniref:equilibrative nucleoside transporter 1-like n=1 Tax=Brienomyrus brachyistius TaxID=42636 RepID=UPI0020B44EFB|nr:equilibrative nucleoside transporter 1-like [Brienomyrus brachyistius]XP_048842742.1 equilibrative nucleoside transporter 1-like [Brienomyrus brachyistius]XP_048842743.1 equilibrative nucleoside transporter 1-like [Brienomyrus brachyistius]XP_048842744.1 equilibrative nucleoside transporter 1-like [Brienomyrus brachyistius]
MTALNTPRDRYRAVWLIFFMLGLGTLLPWNFFMTATMYFTSRLRDSPEGSSNETAPGGDTRNVLESRFSNVMTLCAMLPLLLFTCLNSFLHQRIPQKLRIMGSLGVILVVFLMTAIVVKVDAEPFPFFMITMTKIVIINSFGAVLQGSLFGVAGLLPVSYTTPIMSGQGLAGTFAAFSMICALASGSELQDSAFGYFIIACVVILLAMGCYVALPRMEFFQYYQEKKNKLEKDTQMELNPTVAGNIKGGPTADLCPSEEAGLPNVSIVTILKKIWVPALTVCLIFTVTIGIFPAVTVDVKSTISNGSSWEIYFIPVSCFLLFNLMDWAGRSLTAVCMWPGKDSRLLPVFMLARLLFVPLFMLCNVQPRLHLPVFFVHDAWFIIFMIFFAFSNGYLASLCMCFGPKKVAPHEAETAGAIMAFFLTSGLALGAAISFVFRGLI